MKKKYYLLMCMVLLASCSNNGDSITSQNSEENSNVESNEQISSSESTIESSSNSEAGTSQEFVSNDYLKKGNFSSALSNPSTMYYYKKSNVSLTAVTANESAIGFTFAGLNSINDLVLYYEPEEAAENDLFTVSFTVFTSKLDGMLSINDQYFNLNRGGTEISAQVIKQDGLPVITIKFGNTSNNVFNANGNISISDFKIEKKGSNVSEDVEVIDEMILTFFGVDYSLAWNDEFSSDTLDEKKWSYDIGTGSSGWGNNEKQYYRRENTTVSDGLLSITAKKEFYGGMSYTSSRLKTEGKYSFMYGYAEARIALPTMNGIWPAFWTLGDKGVWPYRGEIDILEAINTETEGFSTVHWNEGSTYNHAQCGGRYSLGDRTAFHTYGLLWQQNYMRFYFDRKLVYTVSIESDYKRQAFNQNHSFILNVAVGGNLPGNNIANEFPQTMLVDYVRVYQ